MNTDLTTLAEALQAAGVPFVDRGDFIDCQHGPVMMWIQRGRATDRGNWLFMAGSLDPTKVTIDEADGFPRYYFDDECCVKEVCAWIRARNL